MKKLFAIGLAFLFVGTALAQKAELTSGNIISIKNKPVCRFSTDIERIYLHDFTSFGVNVFNARSTDHKAVLSLIKGYWPDLKVVVVNSTDKLPPHLKNEDEEISIGWQDIGADDAAAVVTDIDSDLDKIKIPIRTSGGLILSGVTLDLIGQGIVQANPTISNAKAALTLSRIGSVLLILGGGSLLTVN